MQKFFILLFILAPFTTFGQVGGKQIDTLFSPLYLGPSSKYPVIYSEICNEFQKYEIYEGIVVDQCPTMLYGILCSSGTMKIGTNTDTIVVAIGCYADLTDHRGEKIRITVSCLQRPKDGNCTKTNIINCFDTKGVPLYWCEKITYLD